MKSQKKSSLKYCIKCNILLVENNWLPYLKNRSNYLCKLCFNKQIKLSHDSDPNYCQKQLNRYHGIKSAIIHAYGDKCNICGIDNYEKLTIDYIKKSNKENIYIWLYNNPINLDGYQVLCYNCKYSKNIEYKDKYHLRAKILVIEKYGGICKECKEDKIERLTIDHKNNNGVEKRRQLQCGTGAKFYRYLIKNNFPNLELQILCFNCQRSKNII